MTRNTLFWQLGRWFVAVAVGAIVLVAVGVVWRPLGLAASAAVFGAGALAIALVAASRAARQLRGAVEEIRRGVEWLAHGDLSHKVPIPDPEELGALADSLNRATDRLEGRVRELVRQGNEREAVVASMAEGVLAVDSDERVISLNPAGAVLLGVDAAWAVGRSLPEVVRKPALQRLVSQMLETQASTSDEIELTLPGGEQKVLDAQGSVLCDAHQRPIGALVVLHDVTRLRRLERVRRDFVANVSHELKTPVTSIKGFAETLLDGAMHQPQDAERFLRIIASQAGRLHAIIEDLLTLSRVEQEAEKIEISMERGRLRDVLRSAIEVCQVKASEKGIRLELACDEGLQARMNPALLEQAVTNLLDNAIKYSPSGQAVLVEAHGTPGEVVIRVEDHGCGIGREHLPRIFERFYRVDKARSRELGGTGLGLAIVKHIVQAHGGRASVKSALGQGSTFFIHLPAA